MSEPTMEELLQLLGDFNVRLCNLESHLALLTERLNAPVPAAVIPTEENIIGRMESTGETWDEAVQNLNKPSEEEDNADETEGTFHVPV